MIPQMMSPQLEDDAQAYANIPGFRRGMEKKTISNGIMLCKLPKIRLGEALEFLEEVLDSTLTAQPTCDQDLLGMTVWLLTKIKPNLMISDLRCTRYIELYDRLRKASNRIKHCNALDYSEVLSKLVQCQLDPADVVDLAMNRGFDHQWLDKKKKDTKKQGGPIKAVPRRATGGPS